MTEKSSTASSTGTWKNRAKTLLTRCVFWPTISIVSGVWFLAVCVGLGLYLALDLFRKRESKPLISPKPTLRKEPHLRSEGSEIFWEMPDGKIIPVEPLRASQILQEVAEVVGGAYCYEKTKLPDRQ